MARPPRRPRATRPPKARPARATAGPSRAQLAIVAAVAVVGVVAVILIANTTQNTPPPPPAASGIRVSGNVMGEPNAPVTIEQWADLQCPACRQFALGTEPQLRTAYIATGKVRLVFHYMAFIGPE